MAGALTGGFGSAIAGPLGSVFQQPIERILTKAVVRGIASEIEGGQFHKGFAMSAFSAVSRYTYKSFVGFDVDYGLGGIVHQRKVQII